MKMLRSQKLWMLLTYYKLLRSKAHHDRERPARHVTQLRHQTFAISVIGSTALAQSAGRELPSTSITGYMLANREEKQHRHSDKQSSSIRRRGLCA